MVSSSSSSSTFHIWLTFVALLRAFSVYTGYFRITLIQSTVFASKPDHVTPLAGRLFAIWTLLTCTLCILTTLYPHDKGLFLATLLSFVYALLFFLIELLVYRTMYLRNILPMAVIAGTSIIWMSYLLFFGNTSKTRIHRTWQEMKDLL